MIRMHYTPVPGPISVERVAACGARCSMRTNVRGTSRVIYVRCRRCVARMRAVLR